MLIIRPRPLRYLAALVALLTCPLWMWFIPAWKGFWIMESCFRPVPSRRSEGTVRRVYCGTQVHQRAA